MDQTQSQIELPKLLVLTTTFPRWPQDTLPLFVYELCLHLRSKFDISVLAPHFANSKTREVMDGLDVHRFRYAPEAWEKLTYQGSGVDNFRSSIFHKLLLPLYLLSNLVALVSILIRLRPAVVHAHWLFPAAIWAALLKPLFKYRLVCTSHGADVYALNSNILGKITSSIGKFVLSRCDHYTVVSSAMREVALQRYDVANLAARTSIIPMGIDTAKFAHSIDLDTNRILFVGRLAEKKGLTYLLQALSRLDSNLILTVAGDGPLRKQLEVETSKLGLENVTFMGYVNSDRLPQLMAGHSIFVAPYVQARSGDREGLSVTLMEAMAAGMLIITTDFPGVTDIATAENSIMVSQKDPAQLAEALAKIADLSTEMKTILSRNAKRTAQAYDWNQISQEYYNILVG